MAPSIDLDSISKHVRQVSCLNMYLPSHYVPENLHLALLNVVVNQKVTCGIIWHRQSFLENFLLNVILFLVYLKLMPGIVEVCAKSIFTLSLLLCLNSGAQKELFSTMPVASAQGLCSTVSPASKVDHVPVAALNLSSYRDHVEYTKLGFLFYLCWTEGGLTLYF